MLAPDDGDAAREVRGEVFVVPVDGEGMVVRTRGVVDVCEEGDGGWVARGRGSGTPEKARRGR